MIPADRKLSHEALDAELVNWQQGDCVLGELSLLSILTRVSQ